MRTNFTIQRKKIAEKTKNPRFVRISFSARFEGDEYDVKVEESKERIEAYLKVGY